MSGYIWQLAEEAIWAALGLLGFAVLFNVPLRTLWGCALCGALGYTLRRLLIDPQLLTVEMGTLVGAAAVGFVAMRLARWLAMPQVIFAVSGVLPMIPGSFGFQAMMGFVQMVSSGPGADVELLVDASVNFIRTVLIVGALAIGIALPSLLFRRRRPVGQALVRKDRSKV